MGYQLTIFFDGIMEDKVHSATQLRADQPEVGPAGPKGARDVPQSSISLNQPDNQPEHQKGWAKH
jgi:hypothetical protein